MLPDYWDPQNGPPQAIGIKDDWRLSSQWWQWQRRCKDSRSARRTSGSCSVPMPLPRSPPARMYNNWIILRGRSSEVACDPTSMTHVTSPAWRQSRQRLKGLPANHELLMNRHPLVNNHQPLTNNNHQPILIINWPPINQQWTIDWKQSTVVNNH